MLKIVLSVILLLLVITPTVSARTTPEDIYNAKKSAYDQKVQNYTPAHQQALDQLSLDIAETNRQITAEMSHQVERQGDILNEYLRRIGKLDQSTNVARPSSTDPIQNAKYYLTYAHEAIAFQQAKLYVFELSTEANIRRDSLTQVNLLNSDLKTLASKVARSQQLVANLVEEN